MYESGFCLLGTYSGMRMKNCPWEHVCEARDLGIGANLMGHTLIPMWGGGGGGGL